MKVIVAKINSDSMEHSYAFCGAQQKVTPVIWEGTAAESRFLSRFARCESKPASKPEASNLPSTGPSGKRNLACFNFASCSVTMHGDLFSASIARGSSVPASYWQNTDINGARSGLK